MKLTVVGCGDAFGTGGRSHTCFRLDTNGRCIVVDFGASATVSWQRLGLDPLDIDTIVLSHLHGDHFGGLPFLLLQSQFEIHRTRPLTIFGPPGTRSRLDQAIEIFFPGVAALGWRFPWQVIEVVPGERADVLGCSLVTAEVIHPSGAPSTAIRLTDAGKTFAYSGDTEWTPALLPIAADANLFVIECYAGERAVPGHIDIPTLRAKRPQLRSRRMAVTHMGKASLVHRDEFAAAGILVLDDGLVVEF